MKKFDENHPIEIYLKENLLIKELLNKIKTIDIKNDLDSFFPIFDSLSEVDKHYTRKENQLFPYIEKYGWETTTQYMWTFHDQIRDELKQIRKNVKSSNFSKIDFMIDDLSDNLHHMILLEETSLFPNAINSLNNFEWEEIQKGDHEIGFMIEVEPLTKDEKTQENPNVSFSNDNNFLSIFQINSIFKNISLDIT